MRTSIIIAAHNEGEALWQTVRSCVETCAGLDYEIVIADDASTDDSVEEVRRRFPHLRVVRHDERRGAAPTKDLGAREARGDVLIFLDGHCNPD
jgi:glycosyltransferase involved in cell wall biosynthesis